MVCCFTGHRQKGFLWGSDEGNELFLKMKNTIYVEIEKLINSGTNTFITGMADGADTYFAETVIELKNKYNYVNLFAAIPYKDHIKMFKSTAINRYKNIISNCTKTFYIGKGYEKNCFLKRNDFMVKKSDIVMALFNGSFKGGTFYTLNRASENGKKIILISSDDCKVFYCTY